MSSQYTLFRFISSHQKKVSSVQTHAIRKENAVPRTQSVHPSINPIDQATKHQPAPSSPPRRTPPTSLSTLISHNIILVFLLHRRRSPPLLPLAHTAVEADLTGAIIRRQTSHVIHAIVVLVLEVRETARGSPEPDTGVHVAAAHLGLHGKAGVALAHHLADELGAAVQELEGVFQPLHVGVEVALDFAEDGDLGVFVELDWGGGVEAHAHQAWR